MIKGLKDLERKVESFKSVGDRVAFSAAFRLDRRVVPAMRQKILSDDAVASTELFRSFRVIRADGDFGDQLVRLQNYAPHAAYVEFGTGGFKGPGYTREGLTRNFRAPPMSPHLVAEIKKWAVIKPSFITNDVDISHLASAIAAAIAFGGTDRFGKPRPPGTPAQPFFFNTWFEEEEKFKKSMRGTFRRKVTKDFGPA